MDRAGARGSLAPTPPRARVRRRVPRGPDVIASRDPHPRGARREPPRRRPRRVRRASRAPTIIVVASRTRVIRDPPPIVAARGGWTAARTSSRAARLRRLRCLRRLRRLGRRAPAPPPGSTPIVSPSSRALASRTRSTSPRSLPFAEGGEKHGYGLGQKFVTDDDCVLLNALRYEALECVDATTGAFSDPEDAFACEIGSER